MSNQLRLLFLIVVISGALCTNDYVIMSQCAHNKAIHLAAEGTVSVTDIPQTQNITIIAFADFLSEENFKIALFAKETQKYLCFNETWSLVGMENITDTCFFKEGIAHGYFVFHSVVDTQRRVGFTYRGEAIGPEGSIDEKCYQFNKIESELFFYQHNSLFNTTTTATATTFRKHNGKPKGTRNKLNRNKNKKRKDKRKNTNGHTSNISSKNKNKHNKQQQHQQQQQLGNNTTTASAAHKIRHHHNSPQAIARRKEHNRKPKQQRKNFNKLNTTTTTTTTTAASTTSRRRTQTASTPSPLNHKLNATIELSQHHQQPMSTATTHTAFTTTNTKTTTTTTANRAKQRHAQKQPHAEKYHTMPSTSATAGTTANTATATTTTLATTAATIKIAAVPDAIHTTFSTANTTTSTIANKRKGRRRKERKHMQQQHKANIQQYPPDSPAYPTDNTRGNGTWDELTSNFTLDDEMQWLSSPATTAESIDKYSSSSVSTPDEFNFLTEESNFNDTEWLRALLEEEETSTVLGTNAAPTSATHWKHQSPAAVTPTNHVYSSSTTLLESSPTPTTADATPTYSAGTDVAATIFDDLAAVNDTDTDDWLTPENYMDENGFFAETMLPTTYETKANSTEYNTNTITISEYNDFNNETTTTTTTSFNEENTDSSGGSSSSSSVSDIATTVWTKAAAPLRATYASTKHNPVKATKKIAAPTVATFIYNRLSANLNRNKNKYSSQKQATQAATTHTLSTTPWATAATTLKATANNPYSTSQATRNAIAHKSNRHKNCNKSQQQQSNNDCSHQKKHLSASQLDRKQKANNSANVGRRQFTTSATLLRQHATATFAAPTAATFEHNLLSIEKNLNQNIRLTNNTITDGLHATPTTATTTVAATKPLTTAATQTTTTTTKKSLRKSTQKLMATPFHQLTYVRNEAGDIDIDNIDNINVYPDLFEESNDDAAATDFGNNSRLTMVSGYLPTSATSTLPESIRLAKAKINHERRRLQRQRERQYA